MYYTRTLESHILKASKQFPALLLTGPRQIGKTTLLKHLCEDERTYVSLDDLSIRDLANNDPVLFLQRFKPPLLIDEIQYAPDLLPYIKIEADRTRKNGAFWLTGSQQFHLMKGITESLAGRVAIINLFGFSRAEKYRKASSRPFLPEKSYQNQNKTIDIDTLFKDIWLGFFPALCAGTVTDSNLFYSSYIQTYIERDIRDLSQVGDSRAFLRFIRVCAGRTAQLLNMSDIARDTDISVTTAKKWLGVLESSFQVFIVPSYHSNLTKRLVKAPKLYFFDTGLCAHLTGWTSPETLMSGSMSGAIFENYVLLEILKSWYYQLKTLNIYYYRDKDKKEIDFLIEQNNMLYPIEVKLGATPKQEWLRQFSVLKKLKKKIGPGVVISFAGNPLPLSESVWAINAGDIG